MVLVSDAKFVHAWLVLGTRVISEEKTFALPQADAQDKVLEGEHSHHYQI